jgi:hypothetical protein
VSPVRYELGSYIPEDDFFIVTAVKTSNLTHLLSVSFDVFEVGWATGLFI